MNARRLSLWLSVAGGAALVGATVYLVSVGWGEVSSTTTSSDGRTVVTATHRTDSPMESTPALAWRVLLGVVLVAVVAVLLIRFGGRVGGVLVVAVAGLVTLAGILTIGILLLPATALLATSALLAEVDRGERRAARRSGRGADGGGAALLGGAVEGAADEPLHG